MSLSEEPIGDGPSSDSFWEVNQYRRTVRRCDNAYKLATELANCIQERAEIEKSYAANLQRWAKEWTKFLRSGTEYGTSQACWHSFCREAERISDIHMEIRTKLVEDVQTNVKSWQKESFHKQTLPPGFKETRQFEAEFLKAQKPWAKKYKRVMDGKKEFHSACKSERSARTAQQNAKSADAADKTSADQQKKLADKLAKAVKDVEKTKGIYEASLKDLSGYNPKYMEDMTEVYNRTQDFERDRLSFFKETFLQLHNVLNISCNQELPTVYEDLLQSINAVDTDKDLRWWSLSHGVDMSMNWPDFEDYSPETQSSISKKKGATAVSLEAGVTLTGINRSRHGSYRSQTSEQTPPSNSHSSSSVAAASHTTSAAQGTPAETPANEKSAEPPAPPATDNYSDDGGQYENVLYDDGKPGVPVRAIYDYEGVEFDELSFKTGETFEKLEEEDEQGWCKGRKEGRVGLYPANYVEEI